MSELIKFTEDFFKNLGAIVSFDNEVMRIENVPKNFELFFGKTSPYYIVFEKDLRKYC